ncbi:MAG: EamA family transporter [Ruminococcaceae bacterium]|nr:EamA family transporter [Oscillospiraceae bacterium]
MTLQKQGGTAMVLAGASLWGLIGLFNRTLMAAGLTPESIVLVRNLGGLILLGLVLGLWKRDVFRIQPKHLIYFFGTGIISVLLFTWCYFSCQQECSLAVAAILLYTSPAFVVLLSALLWRDRLTGRKLLALGLTFFGCVCVTGVYSGGMTITLRGFLLGLGAGFFYALYSIFGRYALAHYEPYTVTFYTFAFAGIGSLVFLRPAQLAVLGGASIALTALGLSVVCTVLPYLFYTAGLARMDSGKAAIIASVEPVVAALVGIIVFHESMSPATGLGVVFILAAVLLLR